MARRVLAFEWSATPLGPIDGWPDSLRFAASLCLRSPFQMAIYWGPDLNCIYNDAERYVLGALHPGALGVPARELLRDSWEVLEPQLRAVMDDGTPTWAKDEPLRFDRRGVIELGYFTYSYSAIPDDDGGVGGVLLVSEDTTAHVLAARRLDALRELASRSMDAEVELDACRSAATAMDGRPDIPFALIYLLEDESRSATCVATSGLPSGLDSARTPVGLLDGLARERTSGLVNVSGFLTAEGTPARAFAVPVSRGSADPVYGFLVTGINDELAFDDAYRGFLETMAVILGRSVAAARERATERERTARSARAEERRVREAELRALLEDLQAARRRAAAAGDAERRRIERNLHDGAQQRLLAVRLELGLLGERLETDPVLARAELDRLRGDLDEALDELRELAHGLYPPLLASDGLYAAVSAAGRRAPIPVEIDGADIGRLPTAIESAAYFCCLEAIQNATKHAGAGARVSVLFEVRDDALVVRVRDDGAGFDPRSAPDGGGLTNLRDRFSALGGHADIVSGPGLGTTIAGQLPLP